MSPTFEFTAYLYRGRNEREVPVDVTYTVTADGKVRILSTKHDEADDLTRAEYDSLYDDACDMADADLAEWATASEASVPPMGRAAA